MGTGRDFGSTDWQRTTCGWPTTSILPHLVDDYPRATDAILFGMPRDVGYWIVGAFCPVGADGDAVHTVNRQKHLCLAIFHLWHALCINHQARE
ncbi:MAG: hypothetical protein CMM07_16320 [Rhodopirellula sp.]|nr:hypothetical protein [Rhodopirellula sp.]